MNTILNIFKSRWFIGITGLLAVAALIWYLGPLVAVAGETPLASDLGRVFSIMTVGGMYALYQLYYYIDTLRRNRDMLADLAGQGVGGMGSPGAGAGAGAGAGEAGPSPREQQQRRQEQEAASAEEIATPERISSVRSIRSLYFESFCIAASRSLRQLA